MKCLQCKNTKFDIKSTKFTPTIKNEIVEVESLGKICSKCGYVILDPEQMNKLRKKAADQYKMNHNLLTSIQIVQYREQLGMSQMQFAEYLNVGIASIKRWETYFIQDASQNELIQLKCDQAFAEQNFFNLWKNTKPDFFNGMRSFRQEILKQVVLFVIQKTEASKIYLNKILFYCDFLHFKKHEIGLTGARYSPLKYGPCPYPYGPIYDSLIRTGYLKPHCHSFILLKEPNLSVFSKNELATLEKVVEECKSKGIQTLYNLSHTEKGYTDTEEGEFIDYRHAKNLQID